jgi:hypothetical protein
MAGFGCPPRDWELEYQDRVRGTLQWQYWQRCLDALFQGQTVPQRDQHGAYVKLHGSLNLFSCYNQRCVNLRRPFGTSGTTRMADSQNLSASLTHKAKCRRCNESALPLILLPGDGLTEYEGT